MHALFLVGEAKWSGATRVFAAAAQGLALRGIAVTIACRPGSGIAAHAAASGVDVIEFPSRIGPLRTIWWLRGVLRRLRVDVVFVSTETEQRAANRARWLGSRVVVARRNAARHGVGARVRFVRTDVLGGVAGPFDAIVANPPYVRAGDRPGLQPEVRDHEPAVALFGGLDGVDIVTRLVAQAPASLSPGGYLIFEFGFGQDMAVEQLIAAARGLTLVGLRRDLQGIARTAIAKRL